MKHYYVCPYCGANLDPEESCDCEMKKRIVELLDDLDRRKLENVYFFERGLLGM